MGKSCLLPLFRFHSQKPTSKRRFSKCVSGDYSCSNCHCRYTIQGRQDLVSGTGPEVLSGSNQRPKRVSIPSFHLLYERTYLRPATLSSWLKQTILLCYKQADQQALDLVPVKAHDMRAFAASKAFYGGVSVYHIMQACHWKAHNTLTTFYLKDLTWSDNNNNMYLGPVVAAQQVLDPSPQHAHLREEKKGGGGGGGTPAAAKSSGVYPKV